MTPPSLSPDGLEVLETGEWCRHARHYREPVYGILFWCCESPTKGQRTCQNRTCALDGKRVDLFCPPRPQSVPTIPGHQPLFAGRGI